MPAAKRSGRYLYSWADIVALRSIVYLRQEKSLHKIRKAVDTLKKLEADEWEHLSRYALVRTDRTIVVRTPKGELLDLQLSPGTVLDEILMEDVLGPFETTSGEPVPSLPQPRPHLTVNPEVLDGYPVIEGTRVPFDVIGGLAEEGSAPAEIVEMYPSVPLTAIPDAQDFGRQVAAVA